MIAGCVMHDIKLIRTRPEEFKARLEKRQILEDLDELIILDCRYRDLLSQIQAKQEERNNITQQVGLLRRDGQDASVLEAASRSVSREISILNEMAESLHSKIQQIMACMPNEVASDVPHGASADENILLRSFGEPTSFDFVPKAHYDLGEALGMMDFKSAASLSGARFTILRRDLARLERALISFMIDVHTQEFGFEEISTPVLVNEEILFGTGQLPKFRDDQYVTTTGKWLIPTAEAPLTNLVREHIVDESILPLRFVSYTQCFRSEAGSAGRDTRGMIRNHQFGKVELVCITTPELEEQEHEFLVSAAERIMQLLELPYRVMLLCAGDMGFSAQKTYDIEVWLPSENAYREISSCSRCGQFQARRMNARFKREKSNIFLSTLNGSGLAVGRTIVAIVENYQRSDGSIAIPPVLVPYMCGQTEIVFSK